MVAKDAAACFGFDCRLGYQCEETTILVREDGGRTLAPIRIVGEPGSHNGPETAVRIQRIIERDLKSREDFDVIWSELSATEREEIRAAWLKKISAVLANQSARSSSEP